MSSVNLIPSAGAVSVIMPTYNQGAFIRRALISLFAQIFNNWELILINDGSNDYTEEVIEEYLVDGRIRYYRNEQNEGLGYCLNKGIELAKYDIISYLPSDDIFFANHLQCLYNTLSGDDNAILAYAGLYYGSADNYATFLTIKKTAGVIPDKPLQLVQVMHKKKKYKWIEREEFVTADLNKMFWDVLRKQGAFVGTNIISCEWVNHPLQRYKIIGGEHGGGINFYKEHYQVNKSLKFYTDDERCIDEHKLLSEVRSVSVSPEKLKIVLVGELGFNPERVLALERDGHQLYGLWISHPEVHNATGPFTFGNIIELNINSLRAQLEEIQPDIIYALLNTQAVRLAHYVMTSCSNIPFVWHFKEGPFFCRNFGIWKEMIELLYNADGRVYINQECKEWFEQFVWDKNRPTHVLDGDLPLAEWFSSGNPKLLSEQDGAIHTLVSGRPYGIKPEDVLVLAKSNIHLHLYGEFYQSMWQSWISAVNELANGYLHLHSHCKPENWANEYSRYDAGWLHNFESSNNGELIRCNWDDLNYPARMTTLAAAGLPMIMKDNSKHIVASESLMRKLGTGIFFESIEDLAKKLNDKKELKQARANVQEKKFLFSFEYHVSGLIDFFKLVIKTYKENKTS